MFKIDGVFYKLSRKVYRFLLLSKSIKMIKRQPVFSSFLYFLLQQTGMKFSLVRILPVIVYTWIFVTEKPFEMRSQAEKISFLARIARE